jgi:methyl-accepting chemotaxis protein
MPLLSFRRRSKISPLATDDGSQAAPVNNAQFVREIAVKTAGIGKESAALGGVIDDTVATNAAQVKRFDELVEDMRVSVASNGEIGDAVNQSRAAAERARAAVAQVGTGVEEAVTTLRAVASAAKDISQIALHTKLLAFNANVEAKRAGEAGRGFGVVAEAVKELAQKVEVSSKSIMSTVQELDQRIEALARELRHADEGKQNAFHAAFGELELRVASIADAAKNNADQLHGVIENVADMQSGMHVSSVALGTAKQRVDRFLHLSEDMIEIVAESGFATEDTPYIDAVTAAAREIGALFESALASGEIKQEALFDTQYREIAGTNPQQFSAPCLALTDQLLPSVQERLLNLTPKVVFSAAVDRNGYLPTHNRKFSQPQGRDPVWNAANCRNRRIFNDRTGLAAGRNTRKFLLQTYRRDMGGGKFVLMKDLSAPIMVHGRHWGGLRLAYQF